MGLKEAIGKGIMYFMTKEDFIKKLAQKGDWTTAEAEKCFKHCIDAIKDVMMQGGELTIPAFGRFYVVKQEARTCHNPKTGGTVQVPAKFKPVFKPGDALKMYVTNALLEA
jgi:nucleoid DNA-binding protein